MSAVPAFSIENSAPLQSFAPASAFSPVVEKPKPMIFAQESADIPVAKSLVFAKPPSMPAQSMAAYRARRATGKAARRYEREEDHADNEDDDDSGEELKCDDRPRNKRKPAHTFKSPAKERISFIPCLFRTDFLRLVEDMKVVYQQLSTEQDSSATSTPTDSAPFCASCATRSTPRWHRNLCPELGECLCNACAIRYKKYRSYCHPCHYVMTKEERTRSSCPRCAAPYPG
eukprot:GILK01004169.1.p1 GENE.GILK01004169.1~~GILK01004169.1.p1  ORF type:complete len:230 (-),score=16.24 GILK01004169.1:357-1046(-)